MATAVSLDVCSLPMGNSSAPVDAQEFAQHSIQIRSLVIVNGVGIQDQWLGHRWGLRDNEQVMSFMIIMRAHVIFCSLALKPTQLSSAVRKLDLVCCDAYGTHGDTEEMVLTQNLKVKDNDNTWRRSR